MYRRVSILILTIFLFAHCGSLLSELDRIRKKAEAANATSSTNPTVTATDPADNSIGPYSQTYIDVTFSEAINTASFIAQSTFGACSGSFQVSYDGFQNCLGGTLDISNNPRIRFTPGIFIRGIGLQLRTLSGITGTNGNLATPYTMAVGFKLNTPCGLTCFFSGSAPLSGNANAGGQSFPITSGSNAGK